MKYKIWDRIKKRYDDYKYIDQDGKMLAEPDFNGNIHTFDRDDFEVQWWISAGDDIVGYKEGNKI